MNVALHYPAKRKKEYVPGLWENSSQMMTIFVKPVDSTSCCELCSQTLVFSQTVDVSEKSLIE